MNYPSGWFGMPFEVQQELVKKEAERRRAEDERYHEQINRERAEARERQLQREYRQEMNSAQEQRLELVDELQGEREKVKVLLRFIELKGLKDEYKQWVEDDNNFLEEEDDGL